MHFVYSGHLERASLWLVSFLKFNNYLYYSIQPNLFKDFLIKTHTGEYYSFMSKAERFIIIIYIILIKCVITYRKTCIKFCKVMIVTKIQ